MGIKSVLSSPSLLSDNQKVALAYCAASLPTGSSIIEVGSLRGGSAKILADNSTECDVYTIDLFDNVDRILIGDSEISTFEGSSSSFADNNEKLRADMLFIDGDHSFFGVMHDVMTLLPLLTPDATLVFAGYNFTYPGVRIFCDALASSGIIKDRANVDNMLVCNFTGKTTPPSQEAYVEAVQKFCTEFASTNWGTRVVNQSHDYDAIISGLGSEWEVVGKGSMGAYFAKLFSADYDAFINSTEAKAGCNYIICSYAYIDIANHLANTLNIAPASLVKGTDVISYSLYNDLSSNGGEKLMAQCAHEDESLMAALFSSIPAPLLKDVYLKGVLIHTFMRTSFL